MSIGKVYLVGAGPGDPGLITLRAVDCLGQADIVLYDYLANPDVLCHASQAEQICLGRHGHSRIWSQDEINDRLVDLASRGKRIVRLKSGDPAVFARGAEEAEHLSRHGIPFEIVPGITAALAAGSCAGIPVTHRNLASAVALVTGQQKAGKEPDLDYAALASFPGTLVFYMGVTTAKDWVPALIHAGKSAETPTAIIRRCSHPDQRSVRCQLGEVVDRIDSEILRPPVIVVVGEVAALSTDLSWFEQRPLFGQTIVVARPQHQSDALRAPLVELGAEVLLQPAIEIGPPEDWSEVDATIDSIDQFDWLVFSSTNGVRYLLDRLMEKDDVRKLAGVRLASIGPATTDELARYHLRAEIQPEIYRAEALALALSEHVHGQRVLLARASRGREALCERLSAAGAEVTQVVVYRSRDVAAPDPVIAERMAGGEIDTVLVSSSAIAHSLSRLFGETLHRTRLISISPITSQTLIDLGYQVGAEAITYDMPGLVAAVSEP